MRDDPDPGGSELALLGEYLDYPGEHPPDSFTLALAGVIASTEPSLLDGNHLDA